MKELFKAVKQSDYDKLQQLLKQKSDDNSLNINAKDSDGNTLLHLAATKGQVKILELLLQAGADLDLQDAQGRTPLAIAKEQHQEAAAQYLATYAKREIIESVDATAHPRLSNARWSSIQFASPPEQDTESSLLLAQNLPPDVAQLLARCQLNERELEKAMVKLGELKSLLNKSPYGHVLYGLDVQRFLQKMALWPLLTKRVISSQQDKDENKENSGSKELEPHFKNSFISRHIWPKNKSILVNNPKVLKAVYGISAFFDGASFVMNRGWTGLVLTLLGLDIYSYYAYPFDRDITNTTMLDILLGRSSNEKSFSTLLLNPIVWPVVLAVPLLWGLSKAFFAVDRETWHTHSINHIDLQLTSHRPGVWKDIGQWLPSLIFFRLLPEPPIKRLLDQIERALLWDGHLQSQERLKLFQAVRLLAREASKLTRLQALVTLAALADGISPYDFPKLVEAGIDKNMLETLLYLKTEAFSDLRQFAERKIHSENNEPIIVSRFHAVYAHYLLWHLGQPQSKALQPLFWGVTFVQYYLQGYLLWRVIQSLISLVNVYIAEQQCLNAGKLWVYLDQVADYVCSVCGDWPVFYKDIFEDKTCWNGYLQERRTAQQIIAAIKRLNFDAIDVADFSYQHLTREDFDQILPVLKEKATSLQELYLNNSMYLYYDPPSQAIAEFILDSSVQELYLSGLYMAGNDAVIIARALPGSMIQFLDLSYNNISDAGTVALAQNLQNSLVKTLRLSGNNIGATGVAVLAQNLRGSLIHTLDLSDNNIDDIGSEVLAQNLVNSSILTLNLEQNNIGDAGAIAFGHGLPGSLVQNLDLDGNKIGDLGATGLGQGLPGSLVQNLDLGGNKIGDLGATGLGQGLPGSLVRSLDLGANNISSVGVTALAKGLQGSSVQDLDVSDNNIGDAGAVALAEALPGSKVQSLNLEYIGIGDAGVTALAQDLQSSSIQILDLSSNGQISNVGIAALAEELPGSKVRELDLTSNGIGNAGAAALGKGLPNSEVQNLDLSYNNIGGAGAAALGKGLPNSEVQNLDLSYNNIGGAGAAALTKGLPDSKVQSLNLSGNNIGETGTAALGEALPSSKVQNLDLRYNNIDDVGAAALAKGLPDSNVQSLDLSNNNIYDAGIRVLSRVLPGSPMQSLNLDYNYIDNTGAADIAGVLVTIGAKYDLSFTELDTNTKRVLAKAKSNTNLTFLSLNSNKIGDVGAEALCQVLPQTGIAIQNLGLDGNSIDFDIDSCYISSANSNSPHWLFSTFHSAYRMAIHYVDDSYHQVKNYFLSVEPSEFNKHTLQNSYTNPDDFSYENKISNGDNAKIKTKHDTFFISYDNTPIIKQTSLLTDNEFFLPMPVSSNSTMPEEFSESATTSDLSLGEKWIAGQFLVGLAKKYSPFTLPWNRSHSLTMQEQTTLKHYQKRLNQLKQNFASQHKSRAATFESVADRFVYIDDHLPKIQQAITKAFKHNKITNAELQDITTIFNRVQECSQVIAKENQRLRKLEVKECRQVRRAAKTGREQPVFQCSYDVVNQTLKHEVVKEKEAIPVRTQGSETLASLPTGSLLPCRDDKKVEPVSFAFGLLQQFWSKGDKANAQPIAIEQARSDNIPKLPK